MSHLAMIALVSLFVMGGSYTTGQDKMAGLLHQNAGYGAVLDNSSAATVAATIAASTNLAVSTDANSKAQTLNAQVSLPTSGDDFLAKRQVVATAGDAARGISTYSVEAGDTLGTIASKFGVTSSTIRWANDLDDDFIKPGQSLTILPTSGLLYTVGAGDTAESLARKYQANTAQIISFNNAEIKGLKQGQKIVIPDGVKPEPVRPAVVAQASAPAPKAYVPSGYFGNAYAFGQCTYYVASRRSVPSFWGNAASWFYNAQASGFSVGRQPVPGAIAWTPRGWYGHVAIVEQVNGSEILVSDMNFNGNWNRVTTRWTTLAEFQGYIY